MSKKYDFMQRHSRKLIRAIALVLMCTTIAGLFTGCYLLPEEEEKLEAPSLSVEEVTYDTYTVGRDDVERWETGTGSLVSVKTETLMFEDTAGTLKKIYVKSGDTVAEGDLLVELEQGDIAGKIEYQEYVVQKAYLNYQNTMNSTDNYYAIQIAKLDYNYQKNQLDKLYAQQKESALYAPFDGIVTFVTSTSPGDYIETYKALITIADPTQLAITYQPANMDEMTDGMSVDVTFKSDKETNYAGTVVQTPADVPDDATGAEKSSIIISLETLPEDAKIGTSATVNMLLDSRENVIAIPSKYLSKVSTRYYVRVMEDGLPEERDVTIGISNGTLYEITSGLEEGEELVS